ncbi:polar amino acid transport system permease protein [Saccharopolyspora kobensis]|uniref:Polar amino acid transport system permease protein n=1 Tax=Saccharopolyspora kobensis TaxID=146035 RepID=A0A1H6EMN3_9PSEU|nr:ectoine/hydroxyectoine ABC transporter permease subunit EhuC [Saccharopolyspora kobensis]SEG98246.1 polar amino acid transport system permease protein [Saccharopolyspora kobensis]SFE71642.1 polar amino acid transport system permease protein [Saccharopolyspora kobensis]
MFENFSHFLQVLGQGVPATLIATLGGIALCIVLSLIAGLGMLSRRRWVRVVARSYVEVWRGTSEVVQLFWIFFALPLLVGFELLPMWAGILVLGLNHGAYGGEIVRGAVQAVPREQHECAVALSFTRSQRMWRVILPQAAVEMIPPFNNLFIQLLKSSALLSLIFVHDITYQGRDVLEPNFTGQTALIYSLMLALYLVLAVLITAVMRALERRAAAGVGRQPVGPGKALGRGAGAM